MPRYGHRATRWLEAAILTRLAATDEGHDLDPVAVFDGCCVKKGPWHNFQIAFDRDFPTVQIKMRHQVRNRGDIVQTLALAVQMNLHDHSLVTPPLQRYKAI